MCVTQSQLEPESSGQLFESDIIDPVAQREMYPKLRADK